MKPIALSPRARLLAAAGLFFLSLLLWNTILLAPVKLFVVLLHELSHGLAALATGGGIERIDIDPRIGGSCLTSGGWPFVVVSSGYIGSLLLGGALLLAARHAKASRILAYAIAVVVLLVTLLFVRNAFGLIFGVLFSGGMFALARFLPEQYLEIALLWLGGVSVLYAVIDTAGDLLTLSPRLTDAAILASMTGVPAIVWGLLWSAVSVLVLVLVLRAAWKDGQTK